MWLRECNDRGLACGPSVVSFNNAENSGMHPLPVTESTAPRRRRRGRGEVQAAAAGAEMKLPAILLAGLVSSSLLAAGTVHFPALIVVAIATFGVAALALYRSAEAKARIVVPLPTVLCAGLAVYTLLQAAPVPLGWLRFIAPTNADIWERCLIPFGEVGPRWAPISLDPGASVVEALKWTVYAAVFATASAIAARRGGSGGISAVFLSAALGAFITLGHGLVGATSLYGLYQPGFNPVAWHIGPLLNTNNLAGYLNVGALCGLGLLLTRRPFIPRWIVGLGVALIVGVDVISASRGGVLALPLAVIGLGFFTRRRRSGERHDSGGTSASTWLMIVAIAGGGVLAMLGGNYKAWTELYDKNLSKLEMMVWARPMVGDHPIFGIGRGAFESAFPQYRVTPGNIVFTHAENFIAQWIAEWGLPVGVFALVAFGWAFAPHRLGVKKSALAAGAWAGVAALLLQNLVDLALEVPAVCIAVATVLGSLWGDSRRHRPREEASTTGPVSRRSAFAASAGVVVGGLAIVGLALAVGAHNIDADRTALRQAVEARTADPTWTASIRGKLRDAMLRHPAEPYFPLLGGLIAYQARDQNPIPWIQRTLERARVNGRAHLLLAEVLTSRGARRQGLLELRLAVQDDPALMGPAVQLATRWSKSFDELLLAVPDGSAGGFMLGAMGSVLGTPEAAELRGRCDREAIMRDPKAIGPRYREAQARVSALEKGSTSPLCTDRARCRTEVLEFADAIAVLDAESSVAAQLRAGLLVTEGKAAEATHILTVACERASDRTGCLVAQVSAAAQVKAPELITAASRDLLAAACVTPVACANMATWIGDVRTGRGERGMALVLYSRAVHEDPNNEARWFKLAEMAALAGSHAQAAEALERVARQRGGADPALRRRIEEERSQALGSLYAPRPAP